MGVVEPNAVEPKAGRELPNPNVGLAVDAEVAPNGSRAGAAEAPPVFAAGVPAVGGGCGDGAAVSTRDGSNGIMCGKLGVTVFKIWYARTVPSLLYVMRIGAAGVGSSSGESDLMEAVDVRSRSMPTMEDGEPSSASGAEALAVSSRSSFAHRGLSPPKYATAPTSSDGASLTNKR